MLISLHNQATTMSHCAVGHCGGCPSWRHRFEPDGRRFEPNGRRFEHNGEWVGNLRDLKAKAKAPQPKRSSFKAYEPGYIHIDVGVVAWNVWIPVCPLPSRFQVILTLTGIPREVERLMQRTASAASTCWRSKLRAFRPGPMIAL